MKLVVRLVLAVVLTCAGATAAVSGRLHAQGASAPAAQATTLPADLDTYVAGVMRMFEVPGLSPAVVKDGKVLLAKGYGARRLGDAAPVDGKTLFGIASNTKVFTSAALGILVEEGKVAWDAPVTTYLPWFRMSDPYVTRELTVRDLLVHRSGLGLGAGDLLWWPESTYDRKEIARRLKDLPLATSFRSAYAYDNVLYLVAGEVIEAVSGQPWETFVSDRIVKKVGMTGSNVRHSDATAGGNVAAPHAKVEGAVRPIKPFDSDNTNPAGGINSNAEDMAKWMNVLLAHGQLADGSRLFSERTYRELTSLVTPMGVPNLPPELARLQPNFVGYALGLSVTDYRGHKVAMHTGGLPGYVSKVLWIPDINFGVSVLTNQESSAAFDAVVYRVTDHFLKESPMDWADQFKTLIDRREAAMAAAEKKRAAPAPASDAKAAPPASELAKYAGTYTDIWYGDIVIEQQKERLTMRFTKTPALTGVLEYFQYDSFIVRWNDRELRADAYVTFARNPDGSIDHAKMAAVSPETDFSFDFQDLLLKRRK